MSKYITRSIKFEYNKGTCKDILLCGDKDYIKHVGVTLTSVCLNTESNAWNFHIFLDDLYSDDYRKLCETAKRFKVNITIYFINTEILNKFSKDMHGNDHISIACYFRFVAFGALENIVDNVLYLDSDICVVDNRIIDFWNVKLNDKIAIVVGKPSKDPTEVRLGVQQAFNSGVIFVDIIKWNKLNLTPICIRKACERVWPFLDQDVLNMILDRRFISVPKRYNYEYSLSYLIDQEDIPSKAVFPINDATIIHYIGASKPWHTWVQCCDATKIYLRVKKESFWNDIPLSNPDSVKKQTYKYWHKAARVTKKEKIYLEMFKNYLYYIIRKVSR